MKFLGKIIFGDSGVGYYFFLRVESPLAPVCRLSWGEALNSVIVISRYRLFTRTPSPGRRRGGERRMHTPRIRGVKIYGIELNGIKAAARSWGEIRTARPSRCAARVRHLMMLAFPVFDFPPRRARNETRRCVTEISFARSKPDTDDWYFKTNEKHGPSVKRTERECEVKRVISQIRRDWKNVFWYFLYYFFDILFVVISNKI